MKRNYYTFRPGIIVAFALGVTLSSTAAAVENPDCSTALEQVPRDGSTITTGEILITYSGSTNYGGVGGVSAADFELSGPGEPDMSPTEDKALAEAKSFVGAHFRELSEGEYRWNAGQAAEARFVVESAQGEPELPQMKEGEVEAQLEPQVYEGFPVLYREWTLRFPAGESEMTGQENMRYLVQFSWGEGDEKRVQKILVTPPKEAVDEVIEIKLGGRSDRCRHDEPEAPLTETTALEVYAVDLAGNLSEEPARGVFEGLSAEKLSEAYEEFNEVIARLEEEQDGDGQTTEEMVAQLEAEEEAGEDSGCSSVGTTGGAVGGFLVLVLLGLLRMMGRRETLG